MKYGTILLLLLGHLIHASAQTKTYPKKAGPATQKPIFALIGTISPPNGVPKSSYSITWDFHPQIQLTTDQLIVRSRTDTSLHVFELGPKYIRFAQKLSAPELVDNAGFGMNILTNGSYIAVSDERGHGNGYVHQYQGSVYLYHRKNGRWTYQQALRSPSGQHFGRRLAISDSLLLVDHMDKSSSPYTDPPAKKSTPIRYQLQKNGSWQPIGPLPEGLADQGQNRYFPLLAADGSLLVAKEKRYETYLPGPKGSYRLHHTLNTGWNMGFSMATALDGSHLLTPGSGNGSSPGPSLHLHTLTHQKISLPTKLKVEQPGMTIISLAMDGDLIAAGMTYRSAPNNISPAAGRVLVYQNDPKLGYQHLQTIYAPDSYRGDKFGTIVLLKNKRLVIVSEAGTGNPNLKRQLQLEKDQKNIDRIKGFGDIYVYELKEP